MALADNINISTIASVGALGSVAVNGQTVPAYKCVVNNLEKMLLPSPDAGASYQGFAILVNSVGQVGLFIMVAGNPSASSGGGLNAREVWLANATNAFLLAELRSAALVTQSTEILVPLVGQQIGFRPITGASPQISNNITPSGASGGCVSATLIDHSVSAWSEDLIKLLLRLVTAETKLALIDPSILLYNANSVVSGGSLSVASPLVVGAAAGSFIVYGNKVDNVNPVYQSLAQRSLARLELLRNGTLYANYENSSGGSLDADYICAALPPASSPSWTLASSGSPTATIGSDNLLAINAVSGSSINYFRSSAASAALGATMRVDLHDLTLPNGSRFDININFGAGSIRDSAIIWGQGNVGVVQLLSRFNATTVQYGPTVNLSEPFTITLTVITGTSRLYLNGQLVDTYTPEASATANQFGFGFTTTPALARVAKISRVVTTNNIALAPSFPDQLGSPIGYVLTTNSAAAKSIGLQGFDLDQFLGNVKSGLFSFDNRNNFNEVGRIIFDASAVPPDDGLTANGAAISRLTYKNLFGKIGLTFGSGDGSTTFNIPNLAGRMLIASNGTYLRGQTGGASTVSLTNANNGPHAHSTSASQFGGGVRFVLVDTGVGATGYQAAPGQAIGFFNTLSTDSQGSGTAHENMPPYLSIPAYIKYR